MKILGKEETKDMTVINQAVDLVINKLQQGVQDVLLSNNEMGKQFFNKIATKISKKIKKGFNFNFNFINNNACKIFFS
jgi:hypothetical protein